MAENSLRFAINERSGDARVAIPSEGNAVNASGDIAGVIADVRDDSTATCWAVLGYASGSNTDLVVLGYGDNYDDIAGHFSDDIAAYALVRVTDTEGIATSTRYAYITWMGENVPGMKKARYGTNKSTVTDAIGHYNVEILADEISEVTTQEIMNKVQDASGTRNRLVEAKSMDEHLAISNTVVQGSTMRGVGGKTGSGTGGGIVSHVPTSKMDLTFVDDNGLKDAIHQVRLDDDPIFWTMLRYDGKANSVSLGGQGTGGLDELLGAFEDDAVMWALLRVVDVIDSTTCYKFILIHWVGGSVPPMQRGKIPTLRGSVTEFFEPYHAEINASSADDLTDEILSERIASLGNK